MNDIDLERALRRLGDEVLAASSPSPPPPTRLLGEFDRLHSRAGSRRQSRTLLAITLLCLGPACLWFAPRAGTRTWDEGFVRRTQQVARAFSTGIEVLR